MQASQLIEFAEPGLCAAVVLAKGEDLLEINADGRIIIPPGMDPKEFHMIIGFEEGHGWLSMKNVGKEGGGYSTMASSAVEDFLPEGFRAIALNSPIPVLTEDGFRRTPWHGYPSNRFDFFVFGKDGKFDLFQVGVVIRGTKEKPFPKVMGEYRWRGHLYKTINGGLVATPLSVKWGSFEGGSSKRTQIFDDPGFKAMLKGIELKTWRGTDAEVDPPLPIPSKGQAVVKFYIAFAGRDGQGVVMSPNGDTAWVLQQDLIGIQPDEDGEIRLPVGAIISYEDVVFGWGGKKDGPPKLVGVRLVE